MCQVLLLIFLPLNLTNDEFNKCGTLNSDFASSLFAISDIRRADDINAPWLASVGKYTGGTDSVENYTVFLKWTRHLFQIDTKNIKYLIDINIIYSNIKETQ